MSVGRIRRVLVPECGEVIQDSDSTYNVTMRRVGATIVAVEKQ